MQQRGSWAPRAAVEVQIYFAHMRHKPAAAVAAVPPQILHNAADTETPSKAHQRTRACCCFAAEAPASAPLPGGMSASLRVTASSGAACLSTSPMASSTGIMGKGLSRCRNRPCMLEDSVIVSQTARPLPPFSLYRSLSCSVQWLYLVPPCGQRNCHLLPTATRGCNFSSPHYMPSGCLILEAGDGAGSERKYSVLRKWISVTGDEVSRANVLSVDKSE